MRWESPFVLNVGNHDVLVARAGLDGEATGVVSVEFADGGNMDMVFVGRKLAHEGQ